MMSLTVKPKRFLLPWLVIAAIACLNACSDSSAPQIVEVDCSGALPMTAEDVLWEYVRAYSLEEPEAYEEILDSLFTFCLKPNDSMSVYCRSKDEEVASLGQSYLAFVPSQLDSTMQVGFGILLLTKIDTLGVSVEQAVDEPWVYVEGSVTLRLLIWREERSMGRDTLLAGRQDYILRPGRTCPDQWKMHKIIYTPAEAR